MRIPAVVVAAVVLASPGSLSAQGNQDPNEPRPIAAADTLFIDEMTFMEVRDALRATITVAAIQKAVSATPSR